MPCHAQHLQQTAQHLIVVHGRLLPLDSVIHNLDIQFPHQAQDGLCYIGFPPACKARGCVRGSCIMSSCAHDTFSRSISSTFHKICANGKQSVAFQHSPVALITERHPAVHQIFPVNPEPFQKPFPYRPGHHRTVLKIFHGLYPVFSPDTCLYGPPGSVLCLLVYGIVLQPGIQLVHKTPGIFPVPGQGICLAQTDPVPVAVKLVYEFRVAFGHMPPVDFSLKCHGLHGLFHVPGKVKQESLCHCVICNPQNMGTFLRPVLPAVSAAPFHVNLLILHLCPPRFYICTSVIFAHQLYPRVSCICASLTFPCQAVIHQPFTPPAVMPSTNHFWHTINTISTGTREHTDAAIINA